MEEHKICISTVTGNRNSAHCTEASKNLLEEKNAEADLSINSGKLNKKNNKNPLV